MKTRSDLDITDRLAKLNHTAPAQLLARIQAIPQNETIEMPRRLPSQHPWRLRLASAAVVFAVLLVAIFAVSPQARASLVEVIREIGGISFEETDDYPGGDGPVTEIPSLTMTLEEAQARFDWQFGLPAWVPGGFEMQPEVRVMDHPDWPGGEAVEISWKTAPLDEAQQSGDIILHRYGFELMIMRHRDGDSGAEIVGPESIEEVLVSGQPAALVRGGWNYDTQSWGVSEIQVLRWVKGDLSYRLTAVDISLTVEDMIRIAESVP